MTEIWTKSPHQNVDKLHPRPQPNQHLAKFPPRSFPHALTPCDTARAFARSDVAGPRIPQRRRTVDPAGRPRDRADGGKRDRHPGSDPVQRREAETRTVRPDTPHGWPEHSGRRRGEPHRCRNTADPRQRRQARRRHGHNGIRRRREGRVRRRGPRERNEPSAAHDRHHSRNHPAPGRHRVRHRRGARRRAKAKP